MSQGLVGAGNPACPCGRAGPLTQVFRFAKRKVDLAGDCSNISSMNDSPLPPDIAEARFTIGDVVRHRIFDFRGVVFDVDPVFANSEDWYQSIPESVRPSKDQPFYHLFAENADSSYIAYVSQQNLLSDVEHGPIAHPGINAVFEGWTGERYQMKRLMRQ
jgi:heat shock protein HspQ